MAHTTLFENDAAVRKIAAELEKPPIVLWSSALLVHDRNETGAPCPCCGSTSALLTEEIEDFQVLVDRATGDRLFREEVDGETWAALVEGAEVAEMRPVVFRPQLPIVTSQARLTVVDGGAQSGKTEGAARLFARVIGKRGGRDKTFWLIAPSRRSAWIQAQKLAIGYKGRPPVIPPALVASAPKTGQGSHPLTITLIDGSVIDCRPAVRADGSSVDGEECEAVWVDEVTKIRYPIYFAEAQNRTTATGGPVIATSVPMPGHWFKEEIDAAERAADAGDGPSILHAAVSRYDNYSIPAALVDEQAKIMAAKPNGDLLVALHIKGLWVDPDARPFWTTFDPERHVIKHSGRDLRLIRHPITGAKLHDVTRLALNTCARGGGWFVRSQRRTNDRFILGMDVNLSPCSAEVAVIAGDPEDPTNVDKWIAVVVDEVSREYAELHEFASVLDQVHRGEYRGSTVFVDGTSMWRSAKIVAEGRGNSSGRALSRSGFDARPPATSKPRPGKAANPRNPDRDDSHALVHRLLMEDRLFVSSGCARLLEAFERQERDPRRINQPKKDPNTETDRLSNAIDGLRYLLWPIFGEPQQIKREAEARRPPRQGVSAIPFRG